MPPINDHERSWEPSYRVMVWLVNQHDLRLGAEIGVAFGGMAEAILTGTPASVVLVDPYAPLIDYRDPLAVATSAEGDAQFQATYARLARFERRVTWLRTCSFEAAPLVSDGLLDWAYIDANHSFASVVEDIGLWLPKVRSGGLICGHDYGLYDVKPAVDSIFPSVNLEDGTVWWTRRE